VSPDHPPTTPHGVGQPPPPPARKPAAVRAYQAQMNALQVVLDDARRARKIIDGGGRETAMTYTRLAELSGIERRRVAALVQRNPAPLPTQEELVGLAKALELDVALLRRLAAKVFFGLPLYELREDNGTTTVIVGLADLGPDELAAIQAKVDAYHDTHNTHD
jgi:transcriptional regulator with XRE-family HTH domain